MTDSNDSVPEHVNEPTEDKDEEKSEAGEGKGDEAGEEVDMLEEAEGEKGEGDEGEGDGEKESQNGSEEPVEEEEKEGEDGDEGKEDEPMEEGEEEVEEGSKDGEDKEKADEEDQGDDTATENSAENSGDLDSTTAYEDDGGEEGDRLQKEPMDKEFEAGDDFELADEPTSDDPEWDKKSDLSGRGRGNGRGRGSGSSRGKGKGFGKKPYLTDKSMRVASPKPSRAKQALIDNPMFKLPFQHGWRREVVVRGFTQSEKTQKMSDTYYYAPDSKKLRSMPQIADYLQKTGSELTTQCFTFAKYQIYEEPFDIVRSAGKSKRSIDPQDGSTPTPPKKKIKKLKNPDSLGGGLTTIGTMSLVKKEVVSPTAVSPSGTFISPSTSGKKKTPVAKKRTAPRSMPKKIISAKSPGTGPPTLCGMECPGMEGIPPSLHCSVCLCLFHPRCVNQKQTVSTFICPNCSKATGIRNASDISSSGAPTPPPLTPKHAAVSTPRSGTSLIRSLPTLVRGSQAAVPVATPTSRSPSLPGQPMTGLMLTLPTSVLARVNPTQNLNIRVNNQTIAVPPSCLLATPDGVKVFLPPGILPNPSAKGGKALNLATSTASPQTLTVQQTPQQEADSTTAELDKASPDREKEKSVSPAPVQTSTPTPEPSPSPPKPPKFVFVLPEVKSLGRGAAKPSSRQHRGINPGLCHIQCLHVGWDCMLAIFSYLTVPDLLRVSKVCQLWNKIAASSVLWKQVRLKGCIVSDWEKAALHLKACNTTGMDLRGIEHPDGDGNRTWHQLTAVLGHLSSLTRLSFGRCPPLILHTLAEKLLSLTHLAADDITDAQNSADAWTTNCKLDIAKMSSLKELQYLKLRGVCALVLPAISFAGDLTELKQLTKLKTLSLTTLKDVPAAEFEFLSGLSELEELELGDCSHWTEQTYEMLGGLSKLNHLRLESSGESATDKLANAIKDLEHLEDLELINFVIGEELSKTLPEIKKLKTLSVWPDVENKAAEVNSHTMHAVSSMTFLSQLDWGITADSGRKDHIPFLKEKSGDDEDNAEPDDGAEEEEAEAKKNSIPINEMVQKLRDFLPDTKIRVFKVPPRKSNQ